MAIDFSKFVKQKNLPSVDCTPENAQYALRELLTTPDAAAKAFSNEIEKANALDMPKKDYHFSGDQGSAFSGIIATRKYNNSFLTGEAGSGKSYLTQAIYDQDPAGTVRTATTGQAAQLIGGRTLHSFIGLIPYKGLVNPRSVEERFCACKRLIVDEISMLSDINFGHLMNRCEDLNHFPQLVLIGDFYQLPPVSNEDEGEVNKFAFQSRYWKDVKVHKLVQQHRQANAEDAEFVKALNHIRVGKFSMEVMDLIKERTVNQLPDDCTMIFSTKAQVKEVNSKHVLGLKGGLEYYGGTVWQADEKNIQLDPARFRFSKDLHLKAASRIIMLNNDKAQRWINGSTGIVHSADKLKIKVVLDNGYEGEIERVTEEMRSGSGKVIATLTQFPLMLAKAITCHKSQGMSLDKVGVGMNQHFECGMSYVALSRARSKAGLFLQGTTGRFKVHPDVVKFYQEN